MPTVDEGVSALSQAAPDWQAFEDLALNDTITFTQYVRRVLPLDGFVFWVRTRSAQFQGSLHTVTTKMVRESETISVNRCILTTTTEISDLNAVAPNILWVGEQNGLKFTFSHRNPFYVQAGIYHYEGDALYPALASQLIEIGEDLGCRPLVVSNSLPAWLHIEHYHPHWLVPRNPSIALFPSYAVPENIVPPYGAVHIEPNSTEALETFPLVTMRHSQLASDAVRITLYGVDNEKALDFVDTVINYSSDFSHIGMMSGPIVRDQKRPQAEFSILAMMKTIDFEVSYYQQSMQCLTRQLIEMATATVTGTW